MNDVLLAALRTRITGALPQQIRAAVEPLTEEQMWWRPNEASNSVANLLLHLAGSINHFLNRNVGGIDYTRDRPAEFSARDTMTKADVLAVFDDMVEKAKRTFDALTPERLADPSPEPTTYTLLVEDLVNVAVHLATHTGQIVWIAKAVSEVKGELWMRAHRDSGAWRKA